MRLRIGLSVMPLETRREAIIGLATEGDRLGYDGFFLPETWAYDITVLLAEAAAYGVVLVVELVGAERLGEGDHQSLHGPEHGGIEVPFLRVASDVGRHLGLAHRSASE